MTINRNWIIYVNKNCLLFGLLFFILFDAVAQRKMNNKDEEVVPKRLLVKGNILSPFAGSINVHAEIKSGLNSSQQIEYYMLTGLFFGEPLYVRGFGITYNYRYYLTGNFPTGLFAQPYVRYQQFGFAPTISSSTASSSNPFGITVTSGLNVAVIGTGLVFGYQQLLFNRVSLEMYGGPMYNNSFVKDNIVSPNTFNPLFSGAFIRFGLTVGVLL